MMLNIAEGGAAVNVLARQHGADVFCVDIGSLADVSHPLVIRRKVKAGTGNIVHEPAMTRDEAVLAIEVGLELAREKVGEGYTTLITGEMGIGNTSPSAAILAVLGEVALEEAVGRGTGIDAARWHHKRERIGLAIQRHQPDRDDPIEVLATVGGLEIAGLVGVILGAAYHRCPVILDGFISTAAAMIAAALCPNATHYMIASHLSGEPGHRLMLDHLGLTPLLHLDMRLGEGTGGVLCLPLVESARRILHEMATFESAAVSGAVGEGPR
jgi:nicotinate-nucleotide--dimethylbenzimidazole phosphoribosyltransferase